MNTELQKARAHYGTLPSHVRERATAKWLIRAIQIAEICEKDIRLLEHALRCANNSFVGSPEGQKQIDDALARVSKPEGQ